MHRTLDTFGYICVMSVIDGGGASCCLMPRLKHATLKVENRLVLGFPVCSSKSIETAINDE